MPRKQLKLVVITAILFVLAIWNWSAYLFYGRGPIISYHGPPKRCDILSCFGAQHVGTVVLTDEAVIRNDVLGPVREAKQLGEQAAYIPLGTIKITFADSYVLTIQLYSPLGTFSCGGKQYRGDLSALQAHGIINR